MTVLIEDQWNISDPDMEKKIGAVRDIPLSPLVDGQHSTVRCVSLSSTHFMSLLLYITTDQSTRFIKACFDPPFTAPRRCQAYVTKPQKSLEDTQSGLADTRKFWENSLYQIHGPPFNYISHRSAYATQAGSAQHSPGVQMVSARVS